MRIPQSYVQKCKVVAHVLQILFIFVAGCITIAILVMDGATGGGTKFFFALCFLTIPAHIYLVMVPMWSRAAKFANAIAFLSVDAVYTILWFAAFISVAVWNAAGIKDGAKDNKPDEKDGSCKTFKFGPESKCKLSQACVGIGVVIFILFALTTAISSYYLVKFLKEGVLPYQSKKIDPHHSNGETQKDNAWSHEIEQQDVEDEDRHTERGGTQEEDEYALLHSTETDEGRHPGRPLSWGEDRFREPVRAPYGGYDDNNPSALSQGYEEYRGAAGSPLQLPVLPPIGSGQGYSFAGADGHR